MSNRLIPQRLTKRASAALLLHVLVFSVIYWLAFSIRTEFAMSNEEWLTFRGTLLGVVLVQTIVFYCTGQCHRSWHSVSFSDLVMLLVSATLSWLIIAAWGYLFVFRFHVPRSVLLLDWGMIILVLGASRAVGRMLPLLPVRVHLSWRM
jgi:FlaA1/EpsC-like NDP-sugar epimerase